MTTATIASVYDALNTSVAEDLGVNLASVADTLAHRETFDDFFWTAWDRAVSDAVRLYREVHGLPEDDEE